ncbi:MAG TPA: DUF4147 domain-containing protein [Steroidobacteraceae bacterium]|nr:DUF4147 domain-containing protein [Steroidobacteraceae bacterium]HQW09139.1 DUF4147 domain-containing protein [Steroidobacteraceae bacterium]HQX77478.1 DUF4147 domain-containing protein [Steroidobacteraceae bacterium]HQZ79325.1 DUF4147 domain-containing protein [Steroidobacteraceae bacterium]
MSNSLQSRSRALLLEWLSLALRAVDGRARVSAALAAPDIAAMIGGHRGVVVLAAGKAASRMTLGAYDALGPRILRALVITRAGHADAELRECRNCSVIEAAHPVPDERSLAAGARLTAEVERLAPGELPLLLVSGGASSLVEVLAPGVALEELAALNRELLAAGAAIEAINVRRRKVSLIKGGALIERFGGKAALALFISDVPHDDPAVIGSGLAGPVPGDRVRRRVIAGIDDAVDAVRAAASAAGCRVRAGAARFAGDAATLGACFATELAARDTEVLVSGGESTVCLPREPGRGGRNQHLALAAARALRGGAGLTLLAVGTDGTDGSTDDAGALVDGGTWQRIADAGYDGDDCLVRADAGTALEAAGDLVHTGATGTNVGDLVIGLARVV